MDVTRRSILIAGGVLAAAAIGPELQKAQAVANRSGLLAYATEMIDPNNWGSGPYTVAVVNEWQYTQIGLLKSRWPGIRVLCYANAGSTRQSIPLPPAPTPHSGTDASGISLAFAQQYYPQWFFYDSNHNAIKFSDYNVYAMNMKDNNYRHWWGTFTAGMLMAKGFDGVWLDDVNVYPGHGLSGKIGMTDTQYGDAVVGFIGVVAKEIGQHGLAMVANVAVNPWTTSQRNQALSIANYISQYKPTSHGTLSGVNREFFSGWSNENNLSSWTPYSQAEHDSIVSYLQACITAGANAYGIDYGALSDTKRKAGGQAMFAEVVGSNQGGAYFYAQ